MNNAKWSVVILVVYTASLQMALVYPENLSPPKIVGGFRVKISSVPFLLAFYGKGNEFRCGASIISASWGMTAQHCVSPDIRSAKYYSVRAGSSLNTAGGSFHRLKKLYFFGSKIIDEKSLPQHDIMLFKVVKKFRFSNTVKPAKLPAAGSIPPKSLQVSGWGRTDMSIEAGLAFPTSMFVHTVNVSRVEWKDCIRANNWYEYVVNERIHLCYGEVGMDACYGDSGGPLADSDTIYGIVSFGDDCGIMPGIYTHVSFYRRWIKKITNV